MPKEIFISDPISIPEVKKLLMDRAKEGDLSYMQRIALEHAQLVTRIKSEDAVKLMDSLIENYRVSNKGAITIANFMPDNIDELRQLLGKDAISMETETLEKIVEEIIAIPILDDSEKFVDIDLLEQKYKEDDGKVVDDEDIPDDLKDL